MFTTENKIICPVCKGTAITLISVTDDGKGKKTCRKCKRKYKKNNPKLDYRTMITFKESKARLEDGKNAQKDSTSN